MNTITLAIGMFLLGLVAAFRCQSLGSPAALQSRPTADHPKEQEAEQEAEDCPA
jgi:hypothetical protein